MTKRNLSIIKAGLGAALLLVAHFLPDLAGNLTPAGIALLGWATPRLGKGEP